MRRALTALASPGSRLEADQPPGHAPNCCRGAERAADASEAPVGSTRASRRKPCRRPRALVVVKAHRPPLPAPNPRRGVRHEWTRRGPGVPEERRGSAGRDFPDDGLEGKRARGLGEGRFSLFWAPPPARGTCVLPRKTGCFSRCGANGRAFLQNAESTKEDLAHRALGVNRSLCGRKFPFSPWSKQHEEATLV